MPGAAPGMLYHIIFTALQIQDRCLPVTVDLHQCQKNNDILARMLLWQSEWRLTEPHGAFVFASLPCCTSSQPPDVKAFSLCGLHTRSARLLSSRLCDPVLSHLCPRVAPTFILVLCCRVLFSMGSTHSAFQAV